jgi:hypothetical protein
MTDLSSESKMVAAVRSRRWRLKLGLAAALATIVLVAPTALARPAGAGAGAGLAELVQGPGGVSTTSATPPATGDVVLHRDGSKADPFVADLAPTGAPAADGFDWGDAAVGVGAGMIVSLLGIAAISAYGGRPARTA